jgi:hypothetical protein
MAQSAPITEVQGVVEAVNNNGFKLQNGNWLNYSNYGYRGPANGQPAPLVGQRIQATVKNDKFLNTLVIMDGVGAQPAPVQTASNAQTATFAAPAPLTPAQAPKPVVSDQDRIIDTTIKTRLELLKTLAVAQPGMFVLDQVETLTETVRNLETFVLEDLIASQTPEEDEPVDLMDDEAL